MMTFRARRDAMVRAALGLASAWLATRAGAAPSDERNGLPVREWDAIQRVISDQLAALRRGDGAAAYAHAMPGLQEQFGDADGFMRMVREGYAALLGAR